MAKILTLLILILIIIAIVNSQNVYSRKYIRTASPIELKKNFIKARKLKKAGTIMSITGTLTSVAGIRIAIASYYGSFGGSFTYGAGLVMILGGIASTAVGIPILIIGSSRVNRINEVLVDSSDQIKFDLMPTAQFNQSTLNCQPALTLRITF